MRCKSHVNADAALTQARITARPLTHESARLCIPLQVKHIHYHYHWVHRNKILPACLPQKNTGYIHIAFRAGSGEGYWYGWTDEVTGGEGVVLTTCVAP